MYFWCVYVSFQTLKEGITGRNNRIIYFLYNWSALKDQQKDEFSMYTLRNKFKKCNFDKHQSWYFDVSDL
jgi:hypothetical protein